MSSSSTSSSDNNNSPMEELMQHVHSMDVNEAHRRMCLAQDEIKRLKEMAESPSDIEKKNELAEGDEVHGLTLLERQIHQPPTQQDTDYPKMHRERGTKKVNKWPIGGSWLIDKEDDGEDKKLCSIEYLTNINCYQITLLVISSNVMTSPQSKDEFQFTMLPIISDDKAENNQYLSSSSSPLSTTTSYYEAKLHRLHSDGKLERELLLSIMLPMPYNTNTLNAKPTARISIDAHSISIRVQLQDNNHLATTMPTLDISSCSLDLVDHLLGTVDGSSSSFSSATTNAFDLNYLTCRACQNPIIEPPSSSESKLTIGAVLPLQQGYWDDISDYLICYDGQANVDFTSSTTVAIPQTALEDDAILIFHHNNLIKSDEKKRGVTLGRVKGYGEHSLEHMNNNDSGGNATLSSQSWKDKASIKGERSKSITCANCCATLGFVSSHIDSNTYRFYKHLLDCGKPTNENSVARGRRAVSVFKKYTCGSFLAREMRRYAENDAIYTFIVGISDQNDWTRVHQPGPYILLHMLSWDSPMATAEGSSINSDVARDDHTYDVLHYHKVVKVIFEEVASGKNVELSNPNNNRQMEWSWRGADFCCPPNVNASAGLDDMSSSVQAKASSIRIFFSQQEYSKLRDTLVSGSQYFSNTVKDAVVMTKLGLPANDDTQNAALSFLTLAN